jgi:hypothetical protein
MVKYETIIDCVVDFRMSAFRRITNRSQSSGLMEKTQILRELSEFLRGQRNFIGGN